MIDVTRLRSTWFALALAACFALVAPAAAQDDQEFVPAEEAEAPADAGAGEETENASDAGAGLEDDGQFVPDDASFNETFGGEGMELGNVDDLLAADEEVLSDPGTYTYDPGARRDPFRSLLKRRNAKGPKEKRPDGVPGLLIDELRVQGIFELPEGPVAQVMSARQETSYLIRPGDELWDGDVTRITLAEVVFKQNVNDPTALKPFREVVKKLNPSKK